MMVSGTLSAFLMTGVLSSFILMGQNSYNAANYSMMEAESRRALAAFTEEARMADNITWNSANSVTLSVVTNTTSYTVTYAYDTATSGTTSKCFYRKLGTAAGTGTPRILVRNRTSRFAATRSSTARTIPP
jgi:hypothetical protein